MGGEGFARLRQRRLLAALSSQGQSQTRLARPQRRFGRELHQGPCLHRPAPRGRQRPGLPRTLGSRPHALQNLWPGHPGRPRARLPYPHPRQTAKQSCRTHRATTHRLSRTTASRAAPNHHFRQRHRVRRALPPQSRPRYPNLLLRYPQPLAKGRDRERNRTHAPAPAAQNRSRRRPSQKRGRRKGRTTPPASSSADRSAWRDWPCRRSPSSPGR